jgi:hypothetical protein
MRALPEQAAADPDDPAGSPRELAAALAAWRERLESAGTRCSAVALVSDPPAAGVPFEPAVERAVREVWLRLQQRVDDEHPVALERVAILPADPHSHRQPNPNSFPATPDAGGAHLLMAARFGYGQGQKATLGLCLPAPQGERAVQAVLLGLASLQWALTEHHQTALLRGMHLLEVLGHVGSQSGARAAAQEWVNRTAAWARAAAPGAAPITLALFDACGRAPRWWVGADAAWAQKASPAVLEATEQAQRAVAALRELQEGPWWALPILHLGRPVAVLVARGEAAAFTPEALRVLRASLALAEPLLRHWRLAERPLALQAWNALCHLGTQLGSARESGHLAWKLGALAGVATGILLFALDMDERITAPGVIEGQTRQLVSAPFEGFVAAARVRPGEQVSAGQELLAMDTRDLQVEQAKLQGDEEQAAGKLRQAMADHDAPAVALAATQLQSARAQLGLTRAKLARASVSSPVAGLVVSGDWSQHIGTPLESGKQLFEIASTGPYRVALHVADHHIARIQAGQGGELRLAGSPQQAHAFKVTLVTATASVQDASNGFRVEAAWDGVTPALSPGMQGVGKIVVGRTNLFTIVTRSSVDWLRMKWWGWWF